MAAVTSRGSGCPISGASSSSQPGPSISTISNNPYALLWISRPREREMFCRASTSTPLLLPFRMILLSTPVFLSLGMYCLRSHILGKIAPWLSLIMTSPRNWSWLGITRLKRTYQMLHLSLIGNWPRYLTEVKVPPSLQHSIAILLWHRMVLLSTIMVRKISMMETRSS